MRQAPDQLALLDRLVARGKPDGRPRKSSATYCKHENVERFSRSRQLVRRDIETGNDVDQDRTDRNEQPGDGSSDGLALSFALHGKLLELSDEDVVYITNKGGAVVSFGAVFMTSRRISSAPTSYTCFPHHR